MKKKTLLSLILLTATLIIALPTSAQSGPVEILPAADPPAGDPVQENTGLWFVEFNGKPLADGGALADLTSERQNFNKAAKQANLQFTTRYDFKTLWNGVSLHLTQGDAAKLSVLSGVKAIYPVVTIPVPQGEPVLDPDLATALAMTGADVAQNELGYTGQGVRVAVMDTGVDYDHPDLGGCFGAGCRVAFGVDLVGDAFNADPNSPAYNPVAVPDALPDDCNGHGTHVAGIIGASGDPSAGGALGVAPGVTFGAYRVFGCGGSTTADIMIAAMEAALADDMDVLNMSIGSAFQWPQYPTGEAASRLVNEGMVVVASIGNSGANGVYSAGAPGLGSKVIGVASFDNSHVALNTFTISPDNMAIGYAPATAAPAPPTSGSLPMARTGTSSSAADACSPLPAGSLSGMAVLIRRGTCSFHIKSLNAQNAGAAAVVLYNNVPGRFNATVAGSPAITIPVVSVSDAEGVLIDSRLASGPVTLTWTDDQGTFVNPTGGRISSFSSYGLSPDLTFKPDIGAPGGLIRSTYPLESGGYATISGTSMSSPHVAGGVALLLEAHPSTPAQAVDEILQNTADPKGWWNAPAVGLDNVHRQGAGMLDIVDAILATTHISPSELALGESEAGAQTHTLTLSNTSASDVTYDLSSVNALSTGGVIAPSFFFSDASASFSVAGLPASSVTVPAGGSATVDVTINAATGPTHGQYGGYLVFTPAGGGQVYRVPFAGFVGDYQSIQVFTGTTFPAIGRPTSCFRVLGFDCIGGSFTLSPSSFVYTMADTFNMPHVLVHLEHQVRTLRFEVIDSTGKAWHRALDTDYVGRSSTSTGFFAFVWDGTTSSGNKLYTVPDGQYTITVSILKALGDASNPAHWETWTSPTINIDRP